MSIFLAVIAGVAYILYKLFAPKQVRQPYSKSDPLMIELAAVLFVAAVFLVQGDYKPLIMFGAAVIIGVAIRFGKSREDKLPTYRRR